MKRASLSALVSIFLLIVALFPQITIKREPEYLRYWKDAKEIVVTSREVVDGDTFYIHGKGYRLIGIDTPEVHRGKKPVGEFGKEAKEYLKWFADEFKERYIYKGQDVYGRNLIYLFSTDGTGVFFYEASVTEMGLARPLIYEENSIPDLIEDVVEAYEKAWRERKGIFSKWESAPVLRKGDSWKNKIGKIVWIEDTVKKVFETKSLYIAKGEFASFIARKNGYRYAFKDFDFYSLKGKRIRVYGELWEYKGRPEIMVRAPFEIVFIQEGE